VENSLEYYMLHEKGYTFGSGDMADLTPLQVRYMLKAQEIENKKREEYMEEKKKESELTKKGKHKNVRNSNVKNKLKDKYKNRTNRGG